MKSFHVYLVIIVLFLSSCSHVYYYECVAVDSYKLYARKRLDAATSDYLPGNFIYYSKSPNVRMVRVYAGSEAGYLFKPRFRSVKRTKYRTIPGEITRNLDLLVLDYRKGRGYRTSGESGNSGYYTTPSSGSTGGTVHVKGYYRKNGTYVRPHTRSAPHRH
jgi:hypothetical protein